MQLRVRWDWPRHAALLYCAKVCAATLLGYVLAVGDEGYAVFAAFTAALVVGASRGEDTGSAANRVRGSLAGMLAGLGAAYLGVSPALAVAAGVGVTAYLCMGFGWGAPAVRVGASLCAVTVLLHSEDALGYAAMRAVNTLVGIAAGLLVSYLVFPVRGRNALERSMRRTLAAVAALLAEVSRSERPVAAAFYLKVLEGMIDLEKVLHDAEKEVRGEFQALEKIARQLELVCIGALSAALAHAELRGGSSMAPALAPMRMQADFLAARILKALVAPDVVASAQAELPRRPAGPLTEARADEMALQGFAHGLRRIEGALQALGQ